MNPTPKIALVTGAGTGIGKAVALTLLANGYTVILTGRRLEPLQAAARQAGTDRAHAFSADCSQPEAVDALFAFVQEKFGRTCC